MIQTCITVTSGIFLFKGLWIEFLSRHLVIATLETFSISESEKGLSEKRSISSQVIESWTLGAGQGTMRHRRIARIAAT